MPFKGLKVVCSVLFLWKSIFMILCLNYDIMDQDIGNFFELLQAIMLISTSILTLYNYDMAYT